GDFKKYQVYKREPLQVSYRNSSILMNPPPASGGLLIAFALKLLEPVNLGQYQFGSSLYLNLLSHIHKYTEKARIDIYDERPDSDLKEKILNPEYLDLYLKEIKSKAEFNRGTTHISIIDSKGNMAALTTSNGEGSGLIIPGTGVMLNNMLGEEDLHPRGFHKWLPDQRMTSMMAPGILKLKNGTSIVFGSGGSKRIRTALLQLLVNLIDFRMPLDQAINSPRIHYEDGLLNIENGFSDAELSSLLKRYPNHKIWKNKSLFFGGINAVCHSPAGYSGFGDPRRGGVSVILN
ncbi:MAG: gamma-glutamyltransferase, partial [Balneolaceae bacterium]